MMTRRQLPANGFTLIEVVVSLGVFAFAVVVIVGSLASGSSYAANDARRSLAVEVLHQCFRDLDFVKTPTSKRSPTLGLAPIAWDAKPVQVRLWFDPAGRLVTSEQEAFFRCDLTATRNAAGSLGHLHGRMGWPVRNSSKRSEGKVELFTSLLLP
ncbi:MAG: hypothetical protein NTW21_17600 [Verrucomicrobia bacterium]|nr:hypothetical protein [Verrucomicrobiota bacterium]